MEKIERRKHPRNSSSLNITVEHKRFGFLIGRIINMSENGVFIEVEDSQQLEPSLVVEANIIGEGWCNEYLPLRMTVRRIESNGIALEFVDPLQEHINKETNKRYDALILSASGSDISTKILAANQER